MNPNQQQTPAQPVVPDPQVAPVPGQKVQYVITQKSLNGLGGWLLFFVVIFALMGIGGIGLFFDIFDTGIHTPAETLQAIFGPLLAVSFLASVTLIALRKKLAILVTYTAYVVLAAYSCLGALVGNDNKDSVAMKVSVVLVTFVLYALLALYFKQSRRVKETLVK